MRLLRIQIKDFKGIVSADVDLGNVTVVSGQNGSGKSSVLDAIEVALRGATALPAMPVHKGAEKAEIFAVCEGFTIRRKIGPDRRMNLVVELDDGKRPAQAQAFLDSLCANGLAFDPMQFALGKPEVQAVTLRKLVGLDLSDLQAQRADVYAQRTALGRLRDTAKGAADSLPHHPGLPDVEVSAAELAGQIESAVQAEKLRGENRAAIFECKRKGGQLAEEIDLVSARLSTWGDDTEREVHDEQIGIDRQIDTVREAIAAMQAKLDGLLAHQVEVAAAILARRDVELENTEARQGELFQQVQANSIELDRLTAEGSQIPAFDMDQIKSAMATVEDTNAKIRQNKAKVEAQKAWMLRRDEWAEKSEEIDAIDNQMHARVAAVKWPVDGLGFSEDGFVTFNGVPFDQASQAERLRTAMAIGLKSAGDLRVVLLREAILLDDDSRKLVCDLAAEAGAQLVLEIVGMPSEDDEHAFIIQDGSVLWSTAQ